MNAERTQMFLSQFTLWAEAQPDVLAVALLGSHARSAAKNDSDVDLVLVSNHPGEYIANLDWTLTFGEIERRQLENYGKLISVRVWYFDGLEVEYGITGPDWSALPLDEGTREVISHGMVVLFEHGDILSRHQATYRST